MQGCKPCSIARLRLPLVSGWTPATHLLHEVDPADGLAARVRRQRVLVGQRLDAGGGQADERRVGHAPPEVRAGDLVQALWVPVAEAVPQLEAALEHLAHHGGLDGGDVAPGDARVLERLLRRRRPAAAALASETCRCGGRAEAAAPRGAAGRCSAAGAACSS